MSIFSFGTGGAFVYGTWHVVYMRNLVRLNLKSRYVKKFEETLLITVIFQVYLS